ncbi:agamous-like MADS-box protein AGL19 isoform X2 [Actinidia eriantha]|uniref:agamous-like MADS-box protein AGL19 isoform X2 n=1 Tax=Actinidia eriantha TaxID=165200 RepID=UPI002585AD29|nr:agamous-like MADS-box protein AGL19 isoform X2 [Actinidia eriantha]
MVRGKTEMKRIENTTSRQVTFSKRRSGLLKKAFELSVLCDAEVALIVFSPRGKLYEFSNSRCLSIDKTIERYQRNAKELGSGQKPTQDNLQHLEEAANSTMLEKIEFLEASKRLLGDGLESCSIDELQEVENQLEQSLSNIRARKNQLFKETIRQLKEEEKILTEENAKLREKVDGKQSTQKENVEVETELFIGLPEPRTTSVYNGGNVRGSTLLPFLILWWDGFSTLSKMGRKLARM